ncbi:YdeI/OmpD-associated family protein [Vaginisenegalia massiliensis]|uniref:YdeI/OmpD-associated family protein n=1 Tax=Vaginisenegalia massiliensis TaxID=2058294 RepID=UPI000F527E86|nr:YdeI/OmpD-associated family protein [Vaginisenegalia massiliensis]
MTNEVLERKLGLSKFKLRGLINRDPHSSELLSLVTESVESFDWDAVYDAVWVHVYSLEEMRQTLYDLWEHGTIGKGGVCFLVYPKLKNPYYPRIHRDEIFPTLGVEDALGYLPDTHFKFNKMISLNDVFTIIGIKHVEPDRQAKRRQASSGRVGDYLHFIPELIELLEREDPVLSQAFVELTPGRQRQWARHIYSAKTETTKIKRQTELKQALKNE